MKIVLVLMFFNELHCDKIQKNLVPLNQTFHQVNGEYNSMIMYKRMLNHVQQVEIILLIMDLTVMYLLEVLILFLLLSRLRKKKKTFFAFIK
jgi:hypothetical protein